MKKATNYETRLQIRLSTDEHRGLLAAAKKRNTTISKMIRLLLAEYVSTYKATEPEVVESVSTDKKSVSTDKESVSTDNEYVSTDMVTAPEVVPPEEVIPVEEVIRHEQGVTVDLDTPEIFLTIISDLKMLIELNGELYIQNFAKNKNLSNPQYRKLCEYLAKNINYNFDRVTGLLTKDE